MVKREKNHALQIPKLECPFLGCDGVIDLADSLQFFWEGDDDKSEPIQCGWATHSFICPKCKNPVAHFGINPEPWITIGQNMKRIKRHINAIDKNKTIYLKKKSDIEQYLKIWARKDEE